MGIEPGQETKNVAGSSTTESPTVLERDQSGFQFAMDALPHSDELLLEAVRQRSAQLRGKPLTMAAFDAWEDKPCHASTIGKRFGWRAGLARAGVPHAPGHQGPEELMLHLRTMWKQLGRRPRCGHRHFNRTVESADAGVG